MQSTEAWAKAAECAARAEETAEVAHNCEFIEAVESSRPALPVGGW